MAAWVPPFANIWVLSSAEGALSDVVCAGPLTAAARSPQQPGTNGGVPPDQSSVASGEHCDDDVRPAWSLTTSSQPRVSQPAAPRSRASAGVWSLSQALADLRERAQIPRGKGRLVATMAETCM